MNFIFSWQKQYFTHSLRSIVKPLENKSHIFAAPCNILYISFWPRFTATLLINTCSGNYVDKH